MGNAPAIANAYGQRSLFTSVDSGGRLPPYIIKKTFIESGAVQFTDMSLDIQIMF